MDVSVDIASKRIVSDVDFDARPGEIAAVVGPNGSGNTAYLKACPANLPIPGACRLKVGVLPAGNMPFVLPQSAA